MYHKTKKYNNYFKIMIAAIILLFILAVVNKLFICSELLNNVIGIPLFVLMIGLVVQIAIISKGTKHDIIDISKTLDEILVSKYFAQLRCEPQTKEYRIDDNILIHDKSAGFDYRIYGEINNHHVEFLHNVRVYEIRYNRSREMYKEFVGHIIGYQNDIASNQNIIIQSPLYDKIHESDYKKSGYVQECEFDDESVVYIQKKSGLPEIKKIELEYQKIVDIINTHFKTKELIVFMKNGIIWIYINIPSNKGDILTSSPDEGRLNTDGLDDIVNILRQISGATP